MGFGIEGSDFASSEVNEISADEPHLVAES